MKGAVFSLSSNAHASMLMIVFFFSQLLFLEAAILPNNTSSTLLAREQLVRNITSEIALVFGNDQDFLFRIALTGSYFGLHAVKPQTGGIWQVPYAGFNATRDYNGKRTLRNKIRKVKERWGIYLPQVKYADLDDDPLLSALIARVFISFDPTPIPQTITGQAYIWSTYYNNQGAKAAKNFIKAVQQFERQNRTAPVQIEAKNSWSFMVLVCFVLAFIAIIGIGLFIIRFLKAKTYREEAGFIEKGLKDLLRCPMHSGSVLDQRKPLVEVKESGNTGAEESREEDLKIHSGVLDQNKHVKVNSSGNFGNIKKCSYSYNESWGDKQRVTISVAVKSIKKSSSTDSFGPMFRNEQDIFQIIKTCPHPNIVFFYEQTFLSCDEPKPRYDGASDSVLTMEYCNGGSLEDYFNSKGKEAKDGQPREFSNNDLLKFGIQIAAGMDHLHELLNIAHCDLALRNILIGNGGQLKISDFGFARLLHEEQDPELIKLLIQNIPIDVSPPECLELSISLKKDPELVAKKPQLAECFGKAADVWAFGILLGQMFTWKRPSDEHDLVAQQCADEPLPIPEKTVPPSVEKLIAQCCAIDSDKRPSFEKILRKLESILTAESNGKTSTP